MNLHSFLEAMILRNDIFPIGQITKTHGVKGELVFTANTSVLHERNVPFIFMEPQGLLVPFYIESVRMKSGSSGLIKLERINSEEHAREYVGQTIYLPNSYLEEMENNEFEMEYFVGFEIVDSRSGKVGRVNTINKSTSNTLFVIENGTNEILIPIAEEFIGDIDHTNKIIHLTLPEGLLDL